MFIIKCTIYCFVSINLYCFKTYIYTIMYILEQLFVTFTIIVSLFFDLCVTLTYLYVIMKHVTACSICVLSPLYCMIYFRYLAFVDDQVTRRRFLSKTTKPDSDGTLVKGHSAFSKIQRVRQKVWKVVDNNERSTVAKVNNTLQITNALIIVKLSI